MTRKERINELEIEYEEFIKTEAGKKWIDDYKSWNNGQPVDAGDYIYCFYPEVLIWRF